MSSPYDHWERFSLDELLVDETEHWLFAVRAKQVTLGSAVLLLKRPVESLPSLLPEEAVDLLKISALFETRTSAAFGAQKFNYVAAMMKDPFVHFHAFPRYADTVEFVNINWVDTDWPRAINIKDVTTTVETLAAVKAAL